MGAASHVRLYLFKFRPCMGLITCGDLARRTKARHISRMPLHIQKLCVGADSIEDLESWIAHRLDEKARQGLPREQFHVTRMAPKREAEILDGGSLYWVIKGVIQARQAILDLRAVRDSDGINRCAIVLEPTVVRVRPQPRRPFQGWRYLTAEDAPVDLASLGDVEELPPELVKELRELGLM